MSSVTGFRTISQKITELYSRGIINEIEMTNQLIDAFLINSELELRDVPECLALIPPRVHDELKVCMQRPRSDADWEKVQPISGGDEESQRWGRERMKKNADTLRQYFGMTR